MPILLIVIKTFQTAGQTTKDLQMCFLFCIKMGTDGPEGPEGRGID